MIKFSAQLDQMDCAPACLQMIANYYGKNISLEYLREICYLSREGVSLLNMGQAAESLGFRTLAVSVTYEQLIKDCPLPCIIHWNQTHFVVLFKINKRIKILSFNDKAGETTLKIADPGHDIVSVDEETFLKSWISTSDGKGTALLLEPSPEFFSTSVAKPRNEGYKFLFNYLLPHKKYVIQLLIGLVAASLISLAFPFLTQILVDYGVRERNFQIVYLILFSQLFLFFGNAAIDMIQSWLLLHVNIRVSLNIISDFLIKLLKLPIKFFDTKAIGDISQRINDHHRIEAFLTGTILGSLFSMINIVVFSIILGVYSFTIFLIFLFFSAGAIGWILLFQSRRKKLDYKRFSRNRENQDKLYEMINGMQEIKLYGSETNKRWEWEHLQVKLFKLNLRGLALEQYQKGGFIFLSQLKNILISFIAAREVINGQLTLGVLLSISYILGQTNGPLQQLVDFVKAAQDARLSMDRMREIHDKNNEDAVNDTLSEYNENLSTGTIHVNDVSFQYNGPNSAFVLKNVSMAIPKGKITAIVGASGSGKTTLMKLLLNFYQPTMGSISVGINELSSIPIRQWRELCGTVMQDGYIFSDTIAHNIALDGSAIDPERMNSAIQISNLNEFIEQYPLGYTTKIGNTGIGLSGGQKQRLLIARAVYKDPRYLFFDEATSNLDANNERMIMEGLNNFFVNKTVIVIAHRLSTVKNADQIIVLNKGEIVEIGNHHSLTSKRGYYFELVKNQLELGN
jgi:ATP-binding cassette, subfamily B, bacterial